MQKTEKFLVFIFAVLFLLAQFPIAVLAGDDDGLLPESGAEQEITAFAELPEDIRLQKAMTPQFPQTVEGIVDGRTVQIPVTWKADREYHADNPEEGE